MRYSRYLEPDFKIKKFLLFAGYFLFYFDTNLKNPY